MSKVLVFKTGAIGDEEKRALLDAGIIPIAADNPDEIRLLSVEGSEFGGGDLLYAALRGICVSSIAQVQFADTLLEFMEAARLKSHSKTALVRGAGGRFQRVPT